MDNPARAPILKPMTYDSDIAIVGGGLNGPALALPLAQAGFSVSVIDALPAQDRHAGDFDGRAYALAHASMRLLDRIGIWQQIEAHAQPMLEIKVSDGHAGAGPSPLGLHFDHAEIEEGPMGYMMEDRYLRGAFLDAMDAQARITQVSGRKVVAQETSSTDAALTFGTGETHRTRLIVGCDGRGSGTAARAGITRTGWNYGQTALVCAIEHELPHNGVAHQFFMPEGPLAILPLVGNRSSIVWSETHDNAAALTALDEAGYMAALRPRFGDFLGEIALAGKRFSYPLALTIADRFVGERLALVGDAAHGMHPIAGQGLNAGLRDIGALVQVLREARRRGEDMASPMVLARYQSWRRFDTASLAMATDLTNKLFSNDNPLLRLGRDIGMGVVNAIPSIRRSMIREAAGLTGDLPDLMRG